MSTTSTPYLDQKTSQLDSQTPVPPSQAQVAQIPLQSFALPTFPPEAQNLTALTLTSDIKLDEYTTLLTPSSFPPIPALPLSITTLTLELFSLGYPPPLLTSLSTALPNLTTLVIYSQLLAGTTTESLSDAIQFFHNSPNILALHLLDVFIPQNAKFFQAIAPTLQRRLRFLEVNYTFRHSDKEFLRGLPMAGELGALVGRELVSCVFGMSGPENLGDEDDREGEEEGILAVEDAGELVDALVGEERPKGLLALDVTLFKLKLGQLREVLGKQGNLKILAVTLELGVGEEEGVKGIVDILGLCKGLEEVEIVGFPKDEGFVESVMSGKDVAPTEGELEGLAECCKELRKVKMSILRTREIVWEKVDGKWNKV